MGKRKVEMLGWSQAQARIILTRQVLIKGTMPSNVASEWGRHQQLIDKMD